MKFSWHSETYGYALRDGKAIPWALLTTHEKLWSAALIKPGFPSNGPFKSQITAAAQAEKMLRRSGVISDSDSVSEFPYKRGGK